MELFRVEKVAVVEDNSSKLCRLCGEKLKLFRTMVNPHAGNITYMFECRCGERTWDD